MGLKGDKTVENRESRAYLKQLRVTPRKVKIVLDLIRGKDVAVAAAILRNTNKMVSTDIEKLLKSAVANADHNYGMDIEKLYVAECFVTPGILKNMKRVRPRAQGRAFRILKRTSHVTIVLREKEEA